EPAPRRVRPGQHHPRAQDDGCHDRSGRPLHPRCPGRHALTRLRSTASLQRRDPHPALPRLVRRVAGRKVNASENAVGGTGPRHLRDVTVEWLTECIRSQGDDGTVSTFTATQLGEGVGMMATLNRLTLQYSSGSGPATLIVKFPGELEANLAVAAQFGLFQREVLFYQRAAGRTAMHTPKIYSAEIYPNAGFVLLMEDLGEMRTGDQIVGCDPDETAAAVDELVKLHSVFWNSVGPPEFDFAPIVDAVGQGDVMHSLAIASWDAMNAVHGDAVPPAMES